METGINTKDSIKIGERFSLKYYFDPKIMLILLAFLEKNIVRYFVLSISMIPILEYLSSYIVPFIYITLFLLYIRKYNPKVGFSEILIILFVILSIIGTTIFYPQNTEFIFDSNNFWNTIFPIFRYFIIGLIIIADRNTMNLIGKASCLAILVEVLFVFVYMIPKGLLVSDEMSRAYQILPNVLFAINYAINEKRLSSWLFSLLGISFIFAMGTRGPVVIMLAFILIKYIKVKPVKTWIKVSLFISIVGAGLLFLNSSLYIDILSLLKTQFQNFGLSTRVFDFAIDGSLISNTTGRDELYQYGVNKILESPLFGYGVYGEWQWLGWNVHNMYLEILIHYGVIIGSIILIWLVRIISRAYYYTNDDNTRDFILIWVSLVFFRGIFGGSYLQFGMFLLIGFCIKEIRRLKSRYLNKYL